MVLVPMKMDTQTPTHPQKNDIKYYTTLAILIAGRQSLCVPSTRHTGRYTRVLYFVVLLQESLGKRNVELFFLLYLEGYFGFELGFFFFGLRGGYFEMLVATRFGHTSHTASQRKTCQIAERIIPTSFETRELLILCVLS